MSATDRLSYGMPSIAPNWFTKKSEDHSFERFCAVTGKRVDFG
jgi:hypothetical protein